MGLKKLDVTIPARWYKRYGLAPLGENFSFCSIEVSKYYPESILWHDYKTVNIRITSYKPSGNDYYKLEQDCRAGVERYKLNHSSTSWSKFFGWRFPFTLQQDWRIRDIIGQRKTAYFWLEER